MKLFESVVTPSMMYGAGTWTTTKELERQIHNTQLKMIRLTIQTNRKHKKKKVTQLDEQQDEGGSIQRADIDHEDSTSDREHDQDSNSSFKSDTENEEEKEIEEEDWIEYIQRSYKKS